MLTITLKYKVFTAKLITATLAIVSAIILPQIFHIVGSVSGMGAALGIAFLPMHLPVLLAGFIGGSPVGVIVGVASPLVSFLISGMPNTASLPFMMLELVVYGFMCGFLSNERFPIFVKLLIVQVVGRIIRALAVVIAIYGLRSQTISISSIGDMFTASLPGIILQWALIPLLIYRMKGLYKYYD